MKPDPDSDRIEVAGKMVMLDGRLIADAKTEEAALVIGIVLAYAGNEKRTPFGWKQKVKGFLE